MRYTIEVEVPDWDDRQDYAAMMRRALVDLPMKLNTVEVRRDTPDIDRWTKTFDLSTPEGRLAAWQHADAVKETTGTRRHLALALVHDLLETLARVVEAGEGMREELGGTVPYPHTTGAWHEAMRVVRGQ